MNREILRISIPSIVTNITVPLLGMVDVAIVGHIGNASYIAAIALATMVFNLIYWNFGFLRAGTTGLTAQAYGAGDKEEYLNVLVRGIVIALTVAVLLLLLQYPIALLCKRFIRSSPATIELMLIYFYIRIWAAPATISLYVLKGWFLGMQNASAPMWVATILNLVNIVFSLFFVYVFDAGIAGVAWGSVVAQYSGLLLAVAIWIRRYRHLWHDIRWRAALEFRKMIRFFKVNADIFLRSLCLIAVFTFIPYISAIGAPAQSRAGARVVGRRAGGLLHAVVPRRRRASVEDIGERRGGHRHGDAVYVLDLPAAVHRFRGVHL